MKYTIKQSKLIKMIVKMINVEIEEYTVHEYSGQYALNNREGKCLMNYLPTSKELYYDHSLREYITKFIPIGYDGIFEEGAKEYFNYYFPDMIVKGVYGANIVSF